MVGFESSRAAYADVRARWCTGVSSFLISAWLSGLCTSLAILARVSWGGKSLACQPDGRFDLHPESYRYWDKSGFFQITLGYGNLDFTQAKVIDISWDVVSTRTAVK